MARAQPRGPTGKLGDRPGVVVGMVPLFPCPRPGHRGPRVDAGRRPGRHHPVGPGGRAARLPAPVGGRAPRHARSGQFGSGGPDRPSGPGHHDAAGRFRRRHAPQPLPPRRGRTVRHPRGAAPGPDRPRPGPRPGTDPVDGAGPAPDRRPECRHLPRGRGRADQLPGAERRPADPPGPGAGTGLPPRPGCWVRRPSAPAWPQTSSAYRSRSPITSFPTSFDQALEHYRSGFRPSILLDHPHVMVAVSVLCAPSAEEARWLAGPSALTILQLRTGSPARPRPHAGGGGRTTGSPGPSSNWSTPPPPPTWSAIRRRCARVWSIRPDLDRSRRAHAVDEGPLPRGPGPWSLTLVADARGPWRTPTLPAA